ncbi:MAG TPA: hypothetical protein VGD30_03075 [Telluria sp.]
MGAFRLLFASTNDDDADTVADHGNTPRSTTALDGIICCIRCGVVDSKGGGLAIVIEPVWQMSGRCTALKNVAPRPEQPGTCGKGAIFKNVE